MTTPLTSEEALKRRADFTQMGELPISIYCFKVDRFEASAKRLPWPAHTMTA
jgi:hypothetical protein